MGHRLTATVLTMMLLAAACGGAGSEAAGAPAADGGRADSIGSTAVDSATNDRATSDSTDRAPAGPATTDPDRSSGSVDPETDSDPSAPDGAGITVGDITSGRLTEPASIVTLLPADRGDSGPVVVALQDRLDALGFTPGSADGSYGRRTAAAVEAFQGLVDLEPTGTADAATVTALAEYRYDGLLLRAGDEGDEVEELQQRLADGPFDPGPIDGEYGRRTVEAVWALEKLAGVVVDGDWGPLDEKAWQQLLDGEIGQPERTNELRWVEVDLSQQLVKVYDPGDDMPVLISHASSGSGIPWKNEEHSGSSITPVGDFHISRRISGWRESSLDIGRLYNPLYFRGGIALHGSQSVPLYPASHGCIRLPMHIAEYLPDELPNGTPVHVMA